MSNKIIRAALESRLKVWADAQTPPIPIAFEGVSFRKPLTGNFLQVALFPNITLDPELSGKRQTMLGIFEVSCWCASGKGMGDVETLANSVISLFPIIKGVSGVFIQSTPYAGQPSIDEAGWMIVPVTIMYRYEKIN